MIEYNHKLIFIHIPKTGGTSIESFFMPDIMDRRRHMYDLGASLQPDNKAHLKVHHFEIEYPSLNLDEYFKFTFVRNPWDRAVSSFFHTRRKNRNDLKEFLGLSGDFSFKEFIVRLKNLKKLHPHYDDQFSFLINKNKKQCMDFIGKLENFQDDFNVVCDKIGIPRQQLPHFNKTKHKYYTEYYDDETKEIVAKKYAKDIEYFGYKFGE